MDANVLQCMKVLWHIRGHKHTPIQVHTHAQGQREILGT